MTLSIEQKVLLEQYRDRAYVMNILLDEHYNYNSFLAMCFSIPLIFSSSAMTIVNSSFNADDVKIPNIILNSATALMLSLVGNFKFNDKITNFGTVSRKFTKLCHSIEDILINDMQEADTDTIRTFIKEYDELNEQINFPLNSKIKNTVANKYKGVKSLPNILNCSEKIVKINNTTSEIVITNQQI